jgi:ABC-type transport system involved in multi-copper enzyme maturation permease subunit
MVSTGLWTGGSIAFGIIMIFVGLMITLSSLPLAQGTVKSSKYNWRPVHLNGLYKMTDEEQDRMAKPTARAAIVVGLLYALAGLASVTIGLNGHAGPGIMYLFLGSSVFLALAFAAISIWMVCTVKRWRKQGEAKSPAAR